VPQNDLVIDTTRHGSSTPFASVNPDTPGALRTRCD
jgi:hypothetical protein